MRACVEPAVTRLNTTAMNLMNPGETPTAGVHPESTSSPPLYGQPGPLGEVDKLGD